MLEPLTASSSQLEESLESLLDAGRLFDLYFCVRGKETCMKLQLLSSSE